MREVAIGSGSNEVAMISGNSDMRIGKPSNDDVQVVEGRVISGDRTAVVRTGPIRIGADGTARAEVVFDRPVEIPLSALIPDEKERDDLHRALDGILNCESNRFDDILAASGMDPRSDLAGNDLAGSEFVGTQERPLDIRGWDLSRCDLTGAVFEHVLADETTNLDGAELEGIAGPDADRIRELAATGPGP